MMTSGPGNNRQSFDKTHIPQDWDLLNIVLDNLTQGMTVVGKDYRVRAFNRHFEKIFQLPLGTVGVGADFRDILKTWANVTGQDRQMLDRAIYRLDELSSFELEFPQLILGEPRWCLMTHNPLPGKGFVRTFTDITERKRMEEQLRRDQTMHARTQRVAHVGSWEWDAATDTVAWSDEMFRILQWDPSAGAPSFAEHDGIYHPEDIAKLKCAVETTLREGKPYALELRPIRLDGEMQVCLALGNAEIGSDGKIKRLFGSLQDITESKKAEIVLLQSEQKFRTLFDSLTEGVALHELVRDESGRVRDYRILDVNPAYQLNTGLDPAFVRGRLATDLYGTPVPPYLEDYSKVALDGNPYSFETFFQALEKHFRITVVSPKHGQFATVFEDITERKQAQLLLTASEEKYRTLVDNLTSGIVVHSPDTSVLFANPVASTILGLSKEQMFGKTAMDPCWRFIQEDGSTLPPEGYPVVRMITSGESIQSQILGICRPDRTEPVWVLCDGYPVKDEQGIFLQAVISFVDITERKAAEAEIIHLNEELEQRVEDRTAQLEATNQELEAFSYSVSHDLQAPLRSIEGFSRVLMEDYQAQVDEAGKHYFSRIHLGAQRMGNLIDNLLKLSKTSRSEIAVSECDLSRLCSRVTAGFADLNQERRVEVFIQPGMFVQADHNLMQVVLENLLGNAWKYTSKSQDPRIEAGETTSPSGEKVFFIRDNGAGFDMAHADKLFNAFHRLHSVDEFEGAGIGLAIVQRIISRHGGKVWAEAEPGKGATFFFTLPDRGEA